MKATTEYRDSYCWFFGGQKQLPDDYENMIKRKIAGTYVETPVQGPPKFDFEDREKLAKELAERRRHKLLPRQTAGVTDQTKVKTEQKEEPKAEHKRYKGSDGSKRSSFQSYGQGNINPVIDKLYMTTFNVKSQTGVNPFTVMKERIRPEVLKEYRTHSTTTCPQRRNKKEETPKFYVKAEDVPDSERENMEGPFWVHWDPARPLPSAYKDLEPVVGSR